MRYIDADKFIERLKASPAFPNMGMDGYFLLDVVENLLKKFPPADVAPKSEVAREVIEFIENEIKAMEDHTPTDELDKAIGLVSWILLGVVDRLKRKYTEEKE
jgi:hypothetical protein